MNFEKNSTTEMYFFDTYALVELSKHNPAYQPYQQVQFTLSKLNIFEFYHTLLREAGEDTAERATNLVYPFLADYDQSVIKAAAQLKFTHKKTKLSMTDCIGYILSKKLGIKFLTGDKEFEHFENVEFVK